MRIFEINKTSDSDMSPRMVHDDMSTVKPGSEWMTIDDVVLLKKSMTIGMFKRPIDGVLFLRGKKKVGYAYLDVEMELYNNDDQHVMTATEVTSIGFVPEFQRKGLGKKFYDRLLDIGPLVSSGVQTSGGQTIWKWLLGRNDLELFYHREGAMDYSKKPPVQNPTIWKPYEGEDVWNDGQGVRSTVVAKKI